MKIKKRNELRRFNENMAGVELKRQFSNRTEINRIAGYMILNCQVCGIRFSRKASEVKRHNTHYCGRGCCGIAQRIQVGVNCRSCGTRFTVKKSMLGEVTCCSAACRSKALSESASAMDVAGWANGMFKRGADSPRAKLTEKQALQILKDSRSNSEIARELGVTKQAVRFIKIRRTWKHLPPVVL